jgi:hypothetical protein
MLILSFDDYIGLQIDEDFKSNLFNAQHHFADSCRLEISGKWRFTMGVQHTIRLTKAPCYSKRNNERRNIQLSKEIGKSYL